MTEHRTTARGEHTPTNGTGRTGWHRATREEETHTAQLTPIASRMKAVIVRLAVWGLLPAGLAGWIIRRFDLVAA